jgi:hypothetical protein
VKNLCHWHTTVHGSQSSWQNNLRPCNGTTRLCYITPPVFRSVELTSFLAHFNRNTRPRLSDEANALDSGIRIVMDGMSWMPMSQMQMNRTQETLLAIAYCTLLKHSIDSKFVLELMRCFRSAQCCVFRESTAPKVLRPIPWFSCMIASLWCEINYI